MPGYGPGYGNKGHGSNNQSMGGATPHTGDTVKAICRYSGYMATEQAMGSKTRSPYNAAGGKHYQYEDAGDGQGGNVIGYSPE